MAAKFGEAQGQLNSLAEAPDNQTKLQIYALFKQVRQYRLLMGGGSLSGE